MCFFVHPSELGFFKFPQIKQGVLRNQKSTFSKSRDPEKHIFQISENEKARPRVGCGRAGGDEASRKETRRRGIA